MGKRSEDWEKIRGDLGALPDDEEGPEGAQRLACADESCVGSVGEDGCCRVCGALYSGGEALNSGCGEGAAAAEEEQTGQEAEAGADEAWEDDEEGVGEDRVLCSDESCVGSVGDDGLCRVCGLRCQEEGVLPGGGDAGRDRDDT
jgi:hypothetical protein